MYQPCANNAILLTALGKQSQENNKKRHKSVIKNSNIKKLIKENLNFLGHTELTIPQQGK